MTGDAERASRRRFLATSLAASVVAADRRDVFAAGPSWQQQWNDLEAAARKEGTVSIISTVGAGYRKWVQAAQTKLPGISIDLQQQPNSELICNKILAERQAGVHSFDVIVAAAVSALPRLKPVGAVEKLRPELFRPDVLNTKLWRGGFDVWADADKSYGFPLSTTVIMPAINTNLVHPGELKDARSLLDPKWKGKIVLGALNSGATSVLLTSIRLRDGDDAVKRLLVDQNPTIVQDLRQEAEGLVRGTFAIGHGMSQNDLQEFIDAGVAGNVKFVDIPDVSFITYTFTLWLAKNAPHPNAAKLFLNWLLTKEGMQIFGETVSVNARRIDVPPVLPDAVPRPGQHYFFSSNEAGIAEVTKTRSLVQRITGQPV